MYYAPWLERRKAFRLKKSLPIHYKLINQEKFGNCLTRDISEGGLSLILEEFIPRASKVSLEIDAAPYGLIEADADVRWAQRMAHSYRYEVGLEFDKISNAVKRRLSNYVAVHK